MNQPLNFTHKIHIPRRPSHLISRPRLLHDLKVITERQLVILSAPIGYGKTSLLVDFATSQQCLPVCWYALASSDQDPWGFITYLVAAIEQQFPNSVERTKRLLNGYSAETYAMLCTTLAHEIDAIGTTFILIIDDWHFVDHVPEINHLVNTLLSHCSNCHLIIASRTYPHLANLMLMMARRQLSGIGEQALRFTTEEALAVLGDEGRTLCPKLVAGKLERAHGWITGLLLLTQIAESGLALSLAEPQPLDRHIYSLLVEQVFDQQPEDIREFLLESVLLENLIVQSCDAVLQRTDSAQMLHQLQQRNVFLMELAPGTYRYHTLFREFLLTHFRLADLARLQRMAARITAYYMEQQHWLQAFDVCRAVGNMELAVQVVHAGGEYLYTVNRLETLEGWFERLPNDVLDTPLLCLKARVQLNRSKPHDARSSIMLAESRMQPEHHIQILIVSAQIGRVTGHYQQALADTAQALQSHPSRAQQASLLRVQATCYYRLGRIDQAINDLTHALQMEREQHNLYAMACIHHDLGMCCEAKGMLHEAEDYYSHSDALLSTIGNAGQRAMSLNSRGVVQHLSGHYHDAQTTLQTALSFANDAAFPRARATALASLGDLYTDTQQWDQAQAAYDDAQNSGGSSFLTSYVHLMRVRLLLRQGDYAGAEHMLSQIPAALLAQQPTTILLLRTAIAVEAHQFAQATALAEEAISMLLETNTPVDLARAYLLRAYVIGASTPKQSAAVLHWVEQALCIAERIGHNAFLAVEAVTMPALLHYGHHSNARAAVWLRSIQPKTEVATPPAPPTETTSAPVAVLPVLAVRTLGTDQITVDGAAVDVGWLKAREVLYYLLAHPDGATSDTLCDAIWADADIDKARDALRSAIYRLRSTLPRQCITRQGRHTYQLDTNRVNLSYDVAEFLALIEQPNAEDAALTQALGLYRGAYVSWSGNEWCSSLRTHLEQCYLLTLRVLAERYEAAAEYQKATLLYKRILVTNEFDEAAHTSIMRCHIALKNRAAAIEQYQTLQHMLDIELGLEVSPTSEAAQLYEQLLIG